MVRIASVILLMSTTVLLGSGTARHTLAQDANEQRRQFSRDHLILETVLKDLITVKGKAGFPFWLPDAPRDVYFKPQPLKTTGMLLGFAAPNDDWDAIAEKDRLQIRSAAAQGAKRIDAADVFKTFQPRDKRVHSVAVPPKPGMDAPYFSKYPVEMTVPGYNADNTMAVVELYFPEVLHPSLGLIVLFEDEGEWLVLYRIFATLL